MRQLLGAAIVAVVVSFVVSGGPARAGLFTSDWDEAQEKAKACSDAIDRDPAFLAINAKSARRNPTLAQLADDTFPTDADVEQLRARDAAARVCRDITVAAMRKEYPSLASALALRYHQNDLVMLQVLDKRISFANANKLIQESYLQYRLHSDMYFEIRSDRQRQAMAESLDRLSQAANAAPKPSGPRSLRCSWVGPTLYCDEL